MRSFAFCAMLAVAITAMAADVAERKKFDPLKFKTSDLESTVIEASVSWEGPRRPENARAMLYVGQIVGEGNEPLSSVVVFMNRDEAKQLHQRLGEVVKAMER